MDRANTTSQSVFVLTGPASVSFDFSRPDRMQITIPAGSIWRVKKHWHQEDLGCEGIQTLQGQIVLWRARYPSSGYPTIGGGVTKTFKDQDRIGWWSKDWPKDTKELVVVLNADQTLYRNICSATLEAENYPYLASTPFWLRHIFAALAPWPSAHEWLIRGMLWVQIQAIEYSHGYYEYHGGLPVVKWWMWLHPWDWKVPPDWILQLQWKSQVLFSRITQTLCYWTGRLFLGLKGEYAEYTPKKYDDTHNKIQDGDEDKNDSDEGRDRAHYSHSSEKVSGSSPSLSST